VVVNPSNSRLPQPPSLIKAIGPSVVLLGLGLGSGELILWPYLVSNFGLGIIWAAVVGITFQFFINTEIERYSLLHGESIFAGFAKQSKKLPIWFIFSTFIAWMWPGIIAVSAKVICNVFLIKNYNLVAIGLLIIIGLVLTLGPRVYKTVESFQKIIILLSVPAIAIITFLVAKNVDYIALSRGLAGIGDGYFLIPKGIPLFTLLGAIAYAGAGGNLNLAQSFYIKEKGYGMCRGVKGISSVLAGKAQNVQIYGNQANFGDRENYTIFKKWWKLINLEHFLVFLVTGTIIILMMALLAYSSVNGSVQQQGIGFLITEAKIISQSVLPFIGTSFLIVVAVVLFATQLNILDSTSRIISENAVILKSKLNLSKTYFLILWFQILAGIIIFLVGYSDPVGLVVTGAVINAFAMFIHVALTYFLNKKTLPKEYQPSLLRVGIIFVSWLMFGTLAVWAIVDAIK